MQNTATYHNTLQHNFHRHAAIEHALEECAVEVSQCNTLQQTATHCNTISTATPLSMHWRSAPLKFHNATRCNTLQQNATQFPSPRH